MAHALAQSQLAAEEEGEGEVGEVILLQPCHLLTCNLYFDHCATLQ